MDVPAVRISVVYAHVLAPVHREDSSNARMKKSQVSLAVLPLLQCIITDRPGGENMRESHSASASL